VTIYAVDDAAIPTQNDWYLNSALHKEFFRSFFPNRLFGVATYSALQSYIDTIPAEWLTGGWSEAESASKVQTAGRTLDSPRRTAHAPILWQPSIITDANGVVTFQCPAPDNLTRFRFIAIAHTADNRFGTVDATIEVLVKRLKVVKASGSHHF